MTLLRVGTSGFSYKEWKGSFYPEKLKATDYLSHYATIFDSVEINNTFYRMPTRTLLEGWRDKVGPDFRFAIKASQRITHRSRLKDCEELLGFLFGNLEVLGDLCGVVLFQLPPNFKKDAERLARFIDALPEGRRVAFEFRNPSWFAEDVAALLSARDIALCIADEAGLAPEGLVRTAKHGYLRLRNESYSTEELDGWCDAIREAGWDEVSVFFKHEDAGAGPRLAKLFRERFVATQS